MFVCGLVCVCRSLSFERSEGSLDDSPQPATLLQKNCGCMCVLVCECVGVSVCACMFERVCESGW